MKGVEPSSPAWKAGVIAVIRHPQKYETTISENAGSVNRNFGFFYSCEVLVPRCCFASTLCIGVVDFHTAGSGMYRSLPYKRHLEKRSFKCFRDACVPYLFFRIVNGERFTVIISLYGVRKILAYLLLFFHTVDLGCPLNIFSGSGCRSKV